MKYLIFFLLIPIFFSNAQNKNASTGSITIKGIIKDKDLNQPLEYATISFFSKKLQKIATGGITNSKGYFTVDIQPGVYDVIIEYISFRTKTISNQRLFKNTDFGILKLELDTESLNDIVVIAEKTTVDIRLDKKIYNVGKDLTVSGGTVSDVLDNVPSVSVDVEGNVALRGNDNVTILINGKPSGLVGLNSTDALRQLPAESIERVEVITSPSARYDAEGTAGILNIILRRSKLQGLNGAITVNTGYPQTAGVSGNLNYRTGDFNIFTTSGYQYRERPGNSLTASRFFNIEQDPDILDNFIDNPDTFLNEERKFDRVRNGLNTNIGIEWYINNSSSLTSSFLYRFSDNQNNSTNFITQPDLNGTVISSNIRFDPEAEDDTTKQYSLNYNKDFDDNGHKLTFDFQIENSSEEENSKITQDNISTIELVQTLEDQNEILLQTDYVLPIHENSQFELGYRGNFNELDTDYLVQLDSNGTITTDTNLSNNLIYKEYINAVYSQFGSKKGKLTYLLGLRLENSRITIDQQTSGDFNKKKYTQLFPTINLSYEISENQNFTLGYNRRIRRPRSRYINPFPSRSSATSLFQGNPDINPSYSNTFDLGYLNKSKKFTLSSSIYYSNSTQVFTFISEDTGDTAIIGADENNEGTIVPVIRRTPVNLSNSYRYGFELALSYNPSRKWRINSDFNAFQNSIRGTYEDENFDADIFSWSARLNNKVSLPAKIDWQTSINYRGPNENAQTKTDGIFSMNLAFSKDLFNEKASLTFNVNDVFNTRKRQSISTTETFTSYSEYQRRERNFILSFTYRFNQKKKRQRQQRDNEDDSFE
ncbi:TonB-dependent receptor domain-containing protein [Aquimarina pacifica]|uniref:TonB-dependent receptor domain-containing protein n=1 Tax=Aquimarina pacifica TaxID=1296415 RepID=UPI000472773E|nr:TonB-dependent receptor [Aquimarina pacifica]